LLIFIYKKKLMTCKEADIVTTALLA